MVARHMAESRSLALVAMSGVRVADEELRSLGLTLPGFVQRGEVIASLPSLGLLTLAGMTPDEWQVSYHEMTDPPDGTPVSLEGADVVAISALTARIDDAYQLADELRANGTLVVLGGLHVSAMPDEASAHADAIVVGQAELVWPRLLNDAAAGRLAPVYRVSRSERPLLEPPVPRFELLEPREYNRIPLQTTRGCPLSCEFCGASRTLADFQRKPIDAIRRELEIITELWPKPFIELADDNTFVAKEWGRELARLLKAFDVRWFTETDISVADDERLLDELAESGCAQLLIGFESLSAQSLKSLENDGFKAHRLDRYAEAVRRIQERGISVNGCFVFGIDGQGADEFSAVRDFVQESGLTDVQITLLTPFPGTPLRNRLGREGRLLDVPWSHHTLFDLCYEPRGMDPEALKREFRALMEHLYGGRGTSSRTGRLRRLAELKKGRRG